MEASFAVNHHRSECCEVIELAGELDLATGPHLEVVIDRMRVMPDHVIIDLSRLTFIDSHGLRLLLDASNLVEGRIWLRGCSDRVLRLLRIAGISEFFCLENDPEMAHQVIAHRPAGEARPLALPT